jgi:hypothetical protein
LINFSITDLDWLRRYNRSWLCGDVVAPGLAAFILAATRLLLLPIQL